MSLRAGREWVVYVEGSDQNGALCTADDAVGLRQVLYRSTTTKDGRTWTAIYSVRPNRSGIFTVTCEETGRTSDALFAIAEDPDESGFLASVAGLFGLTFLGGVAGGIVALVTALRRRRAARAPPSGPGFPPPSRLAG